MNNSLVKSFASIIFTRKEMNEYSVDLSQFSLPKITKGVTTVKFKGLEYKMEGDSLQYGNFDLNIIIDNELEIYDFLSNWFLLGKSYKTGNVTELSDYAKLLIFRPDGDNKKLRKEILIRGIKIIELGELKVDATRPEAWTSCSCTFACNSIEKVESNS